MFHPPDLVSHCVAYACLQLQLVESRYLRTKVTVVSIIHLSFVLEIPHFLSMCRVPVPSYSRSGVGGAQSGGSARLVSSCWLQYIWNKFAFLWGEA